MTGTPMSPAELLRFAAAGRREFAVRANEADREDLLASADWYEEAAKLMDDPARIWMIVPTWLSVPDGRIDPRDMRPGS